MKYLLTIILPLLLLGASIEDARKANKAYNNGNYEEAISLYKKAIDAEPKNAKLFFNLASAQAKAGKSQEAIRTFEQYKTMTDDPENRARANYNIGNVLAEMKKWDKAVEYYRRSLRHMSKDSDAKHNYEFAKEMKRQQKKKKQQQGKQNKQQQKKQDQQKQKKEQKQQQNQQQQSQQQQQQQQKTKQDQQKQPQKISKAEAEKILQALEQKEKKLLKQFKKKKTESSKSKNEKDW